MSEICHRMHHSGRKMETFADGMLVNLVKKVQNK